MKRINTITIIILLILAYILYKYWDKQRKINYGEYVDTLCRKPDFSGFTDYTTNVCYEVVLDQDLLLKNGDMGCEVKNLQLRINQVLSSGTPQGQTPILIAEDGKFGCNTEGALKKVRNTIEITLNQF